MTKKTRRVAKARRALLSLSLVLVVAFAAVGGTIAWLTAETAPLVNTFTVGDINITLTETTKDYKMVPGNDIAKDPKVTVEAESEACWLFVKVVKSANYDTYLTHSIADGWTELTEGSGIYWRQVNATDAKNGVSYYVLAGNEDGTTNPNGQVTVLEGVTKTQLETAETNAPTLTFTAYAVQSDNVADAATAWAKVNP